MNWLRIDCSLLNHPKVGRLQRQLGCSRTESLGVIVSLWGWVGSSRSDGFLAGLSPEDIADACRWDTDPVKTVEALVSAGWIDRDDSGLSVHEWDDYQRETEKSKLLNQKRQERYRESHPPAGKRNATVTVHRDTPLTKRLTDGTDCTDGADGRNGADGADGAAAPSATADVAALPGAGSPDTGNDPIIATFPVIGGSWPCRDSTARKLDEFFPDLCIDDEIREAKAWISAKPDRLKPPGEMVAFLTGWLQRTRNGRKNGGKHATA